MSLDQLYADAEEAFRHGKVEQGLARLRQAAQAGHPAAGQRLALYLLHFEPDSGAAEALRLLEEGLRVGHPSAAYHCACIAVGGSLLEVPMRQIAQWLLDSAAGGLTQALRAVAWLLWHADKPEQARGWWQAGAARGDAVAQTLLAVSSAGGGPGADAPELLQAEALAGYLDAGLAAAPAQTLASSPLIRIVDGQLSELECGLLVGTAQARLRRSTVHNMASGSSGRHPIRTSSDFTLDSLEEDFVLRWIQTRLASVAGCRLVQAEPLVVLHYAPGEEYRPHRDDLDAKSLVRSRPQAGQRWRTIITYLCDVESGGETEFPLLALRVSPRRGRSLIFENLGPEGQPEPHSLHAGLPVRSGTKWLATLWLRQRPYRQW